MEYIYLVYQEKSFSKAAKKLFVSQSAVSAMVKKMEGKLGCQIFDRSTIPLSVTKEGMYYISCIERFMTLEKDMDAYFKDVSDVKTGHLSVGSSSFFCAYLLADLLKRFKKKYPGMHVEIHEGNIKELKAGLMNGTIDFLLETAIPAGESVERYLFDHEDIILAVPADYEVNKRLREYNMTFQEARDGVFRQAKFPAVDLSVFSGYPFILLKPENDIAARRMEICKNAGFIPTVELYLDQIMTAFYVAKSGAGITFIRNSLLSLITDTDELCYYKIGDPLARREIYVTCKKGRYKTKAIEVFLSLCGISLEKNDV